MNTLIDDILDIIQDQGVYEIEGIDPETVAEAKSELLKAILAQKKTFTERIESGGEYIDYEVVPVSAIKELFGVE